MPDNKQRLLEHYADMRKQMQAALSGLTPQQFTETSIDGWSVKDHLLHIATWDEIRADEVTRISAGHATAWRMTGEQDGAYNELSYALRRDLSLEQAMWEWETSRQQLLDAISAGPERALDPALYGEAGLVSHHEAQHAGWIKDWRARQGY